MLEFKLKKTEPKKPELEKTENQTTPDSLVKADVGVMYSEKNQELCLKLIKAETEEEIKAILRKHNYWGDSNKYWEETGDWTHFGGIKNNWGVIGGQSGSADYALVEKLTNSIDHVLLRECKRKKINPEGTRQDGTPQTMQEAVEKFFGIPKGKLSECVPSERTKHAENIKLIATGQKKSPCYIIADQGEGQPPEKMCDTLLSISKENKIKIRFVQGKFNQGSTAVFRFCNFQLILSKQDPKLSENPKSENSWGFTIAYVKEASDSEPNPSVRYLAPEGKILSFDASSLPILPGKHPEPYENEMEFGTFIKLYEYNFKVRAYNTAIYFDLYNRLAFLLEGACLPIRLYERRGYSSRSYENTLSGLQVRLEDSRESGLGDNLECDPIPIDLLPMPGEKVKGRCYVFKEGKKENYAKNEGIIYSINGQSHGDSSQQFFNRQAVGLGFLSKSLLVVLDCTNISNSEKSRLFMTSRDRMSTESEIARKIERELEKVLKEHKGLRALNAKRKEEKINDKLSDEKPIKDILEKVLEQSSTLLKIISEGKDLPGPKSKSDGLPMPPSPPELRQFPKEFKLEKKYPREKARKYSKDVLTVSYKTDAENDYFERFSDPGEIKLYVNNQPYKNFTMNLWEGKGLLKIWELYT